MQFRGTRNHFRSAFWMALLLGVSKVAVAALPSGVSFLSDFIEDPQRGKWAHIQVVSLDRLTASAERTHHNKPAALVDVRPGDNPLSCCVGSERAEILHMRSDSGSILYETPESGTQYYGVSYKFPTDFNTSAYKTSSSGLWQIVLQLHGLDAMNASPAFALNVRHGRYAVTTNGGDLVKGNRFVQRELFDSSLNLGYWTDLMIRIKFASDNTGSVTIWRRNETETRFREVLHLDGIPTLQYNSGLKIPPGKHYWKQGMYRSAMSVRNQFWMGPISRASSFAAAERAAFNTKSGMPK